MNEFKSPRPGRDSHANMYSFLVFASLVCLATPVENAFSIMQPYRAVANNGEATVECLYASALRHAPEELHVTLLKGFHERAIVCGGYVNSTHPSMSTREPNACRIAMGDGGISVTILSLKGDDTDMYLCKVQVMYPPPYLSRVGNGTLVYVPEKPDCSLPEVQLLTQRRAPEHQADLDQMGTSGTPVQEKKPVWGVQWVELPLILVVALGILIVLSITCQVMGIRHSRRHSRGLLLPTAVTVPKIIH